jgi:hypothetical protein
MNLLCCFSATLFEEIAAESNRWKQKNLYNMNRQSEKLPSLSHWNFVKKVVEVLVANVEEKKRPEREENQVEQIQKTI